MMNTMTKLPAAMLRNAGNNEPLLEVGFPPPNLVAVADKRYVNRYHYNAATDEWMLIVDAQLIDGISHWAMRLADPEDGRPIGQVQKHTLDIWANRFADRPFDVRAFVEGKMPTDLFVDWRQTFCPRSMRAEKARELFDSYLARLNYCSSFDALVRLGLRQQ